MSAGAKARHATRRYLQPGSSLRLHGSTETANSSPPHQYAAHKRSSEAQTTVTNCLEEHKVQDLISARLQRCQEMGCSTGLSSDSRDRRSSSLC
ncbi:hypothetical protein EYF80_010792 [Liparis tanakae]|uniref:Uncharacterized protein n=1 Tax=Liparis tanakae TaxID=230148 RepID=A0A4Z2IPL1_9TELE|nr:hypothetical protein EYF80_010792 [Liparis tanakae]